MIGTQKSTLTEILSKVMLQIKMQEKHKVISRLNMCSTENVHYFAEYID